MNATTQRSFFPYWLASIFVLFIGIMIYVYIEAKKANPIVLDEHGRPRQTGYRAGY